MHRQAWAASTVVSVLLLLLIEAYALSERGKKKPSIFTLAPVRSL